MTLVDQIYLVTRQFPNSEKFALANQMQRAAVAIPSNIAEGHKRNHKPEYIQFLAIANASTAELETQLLIAKKQYPSISYTEADLLLTEIQKMLHVLIKKLKYP